MPCERALLAGAATSWKNLALGEKPAAHKPSYVRLEKSGKRLDPLPKEPLRATSADWKRIVMTPRVNALENCAIVTCGWRLLAIDP